MSVHRTVLLNETIDGLDLRPDSVVLDCTFGGGGHSAEILKRFSKAKIIALDQDKGAWRENDRKISFFNVNFRDLDKVLKNEKVDGIIFDLGLSSDQLENSGRGFSFMKDEPLLMTMKENPGPEDVTAYDVVNTWDEKNLADIIYGYGEERFSRRIAKGIVEARKKAEIKTTFDLVKIIAEAVPAAYRRGRLHFATRTFQAIRIAVNDELGALQEGLEKGFEALKVGGRMAVISFHSLEDRIVKNFYKVRTKEKKAILINKKPVLANKEELKNNPRARSAKLRVLEKITAAAGQV
ncbi:MAG: Ribosomal RNA small subunit methyltransferase H [Candidatus Nomurabacteria bacterium GW2011_GWF2_43_8]|uniref:Ribosomal RNA small subunit methyltransferase H n=3 Tax=Candidatus Nomuraibacteriota TaxID=1752729 RepID=A0A0G1FRI3_9BACT|nr:MAG: Ribosomal RNA small subunit methyltransferase H [Candidatus Nomurabacteria bacterium GW2011_GWA2_43_15]KKT19114.1 MAG: Ribosomal RNA small subunit methyltransferase H [Candidatus Nomurabacteria bacterium GW2011_GWB1_43_7]KKT25005.1 MAG: Ribosomal RNA small subunit methyltransferase H [Candidatus Nomurabacteria bacterium GW2011_GWF2_43_8]